MQTIPKIIHQIWVGPKPQPEEAARFTASWREHHPGWEMHLWTDENVPQDLLNQGIYEETSNLSQKADILKHELMNRFGGVYVDIDFECLRNIEPLLAGVSYFYGEELPGRPALGILGSTPGHPFSRWCQERIPDLWPWQPGRILDETGPDFFARAVESYLGEHSRAAVIDPLSGAEAGSKLIPGGRPSLHAFQRWVVYPYYLGEDWVPEDHPNAYAAHHWQKNWDW